MEHLKISFVVSDLTRDDAINVVNTIQNNMYDNVSMCGIVDVSIPCSEISVDSFSLKGESESVDVISDKTKRYEFVESNSSNVLVGDAFIIECEFYSVVHFEDRWFLYSFTANRALYSYDNIKTKEELREIINLDHADNKFYKRI